MTRQDLIELARWIISVNGCVSQAEKDEFFFGALNYFKEEFQNDNMKNDSNI